MNPASKSERELDRIAHEAAAWILRRDRGLTAAEQDEFSQWLAADQRHGICLGRHGRHWQRLDQLMEWRPAYSVRPNPDLLATDRRHSRWLLPLSLAAAAAAIAFFVGRTELATHHAALATAYSPIPLIEERILDDGSNVQVNRGGTVTVAFSPATRQVHLERGEAHFKVAKNPSRPFVVDARGIEIRAVGTAFDVRIDGKKVIVLVMEGRVQVNVGGPDVGLPARSGALRSSTPIIAAGHCAVVSLLGEEEPIEVAVVSPRKMERLLSWQPRLLDFTAAPLSEIVAEFNRHNPVKLVVEGAGLAALRISASFRSDNVEGFVSLLGAGFGVHAERRGPDQIVLRQSR